MKTVLSVVCKFLSLLLLAGPALAEKTPPNVVLIFADDLGYGDLGCYGATKINTPNIDKLAAEGRRFTDAHSASAVCTPSRYALLTGEYPHRIGISAPVFDKTGLIIDPEQTTMADVLKDAGYRTACIGKWHLGFGDKRPDWNGELKPGPLELGFDYYYGVPVVNSHPPFVYVENHRVVGLVEDDPIVYGKPAKTKTYPEKMGVGKMGGGDAAHALYDDAMVGTHLTKKAVSWIKQKKDDPFFLYFSTTNIHHPFTPHPRFVGSSECGLYGDYTHELDWMVGEITRTLEEESLAENTLIIFTSDNGGMLNETAQRAWKMGHEQNADLFGFKFDAWEGGHRVPFIVKWPGRVPAGTVSDALICNVDLLATVAEITGVSYPEGQAQDSVNLLPAFTEASPEPVRDELVVAAWKQTHLSLRKGDWMFIPKQLGGGFQSKKVGSHTFGGPAGAQFAKRVNSDIAEGKLKKNAAPGQLYNLKDDPNQTTNLYRKHPDIVKQMAAALAAYTK